MDISFWLKVSSEKDYDVLIFTIDGIEKGRWSGDVAWTKVSYPVTAREHTFAWKYSKDGEVSKGSDTAWIDDIIFPKANPCPDQDGVFYLIPNKRGRAAVIYLED